MYLIILIILVRLCMSGRPEKIFKPLHVFSTQDAPSPRSIDMINTIVKKALNDKLWIFDPSIKRWFNPEEFYEQYYRYDNLDRKWIDKIQILDPMDGLKAADDQIESITARRIVFEKKIIDYYRNYNK